MSLASQIHCYYSSPAHLSNHSLKKPETFEYREKNYTKSLRFYVTCCIIFVSLADWNKVNSFFSRLFSGCVGDEIDKGESQESVACVQVDLFVIRNEKAQKIQ